MSFKKLFIVLLMMLSFSVPGAALADCNVSEGGWGSIGCRIAGNTGGLATATKKLGLLIGIALSVGALIGFATHKKTNTPLSIPAIMLLAGIMLTSLTAFINSGSETVFGPSNDNNWQELLSQ